jgi:two-component system nitrogen regulation response regulator GlnG
MIKIMISDENKKAQKLLRRLLQQDGLAEKPYNINWLRRGIIELEDQLYNEKKGLVYRIILEAIERPLIEQVLVRTEGNQLKAAKILGINRNTMRAKIKKLMIDVDKIKR